MFRDGIAVGAARLRLRRAGPAGLRPGRVRPDVRADRRREPGALRLAPADLEERLRLVADSYGVPAGRDELFDALADGIAAGGEFVQRRVEAGDENFIEMWESMGGMARFDRRRAWFAAHADRFADALG